MASLRAIGMAGTVVVARWLGPAAFGAASLPHQVGGMVGTAIGYGTATAATKTVSEQPVDARTDAIDTARRIAAVVGIGLITASVAVASVLQLCGRTETAGASLATGAIAALTVRQLTNLGLIASLGRYRSQAVAGTVGSVVGVVSLLLLAWTGSITAATVGLVVLVAAQTVAIGRVLPTRIRRSPSRQRVAASRRRVALFWRTATPAAIVASLGVVGQLGGVAILWASHPAGDEFGLFMAANQIFVLLMFVPSTLAAVLFPVLVERRTGAAGLGLAGVVLAAALPVGVAWLLADAIVALYGPAYFGLLAPLRWSLLTVLAAAVLRPTYHALAADEKLAAAPCLAGVSAVVLIAAAWAWRADGATGLAAARCLSFALHMVLAGGWLLTTPAARVQVAT